MIIKLLPAVPGIFAVHGSMCPPGQHLVTVQKFEQVEDCFQYTVCCHCFGDKENLAVPASIV